jgi:hypothetical protein
MCTTTSRPPVPTNASRANADARQPKPANSKGRRPPIPDVVAVAHISDLSSLKPRDVASERERKRHRQRLDTDVAPPSPSHLISSPLLSSPPSLSSTGGGSEARETPPTPRGSTKPSPHLGSTPLPNRHGAPLRVSSGRRHRRIEDIDARRTLRQSSALCIFNGRRRRYRAEVISPSSFSSGPPFFRSASIHS